MSKLDINYYMGLESCWEYLKTTENPVFIYGMGDGALKILKQFEKYNIPCSGFFASDEFVRGHYFEGHLVHKLSDIEKIVPDFEIVLAFAAGYNSLIEKIKLLSEKHNVLAPDVPVYGDTVFTKEFVKDNFQKFCMVYDMLEDEKSKQVYKNIIEYKITGKINLLINHWTTPRQSYKDILNLGNNEIYIDLGAYNGDTFREFVEYTGGKYRKIIAVEPDRRNYKKLCIEAEGYKNTECLNCAVWSKDTELVFSDTAGRQSKQSDKGKLTEARSLDSILNGEEATFIKMDVEGSEKQAITGAENTIKKYKPQIKCSLYHRSEDLFEIPLQIKEIVPEYKLYIRQYKYIPSWEVNLYAVR